MFHNFRRYYFVSQYRNISRRNPSVLCFRKFSADQKFMDKSGWKRGGRLKIFRPNFFSHSSKNFSRGTLLCFRKFLVSKHFKPNRRILPFSIGILFLKVLKNIVGEPFCVSQKNCSRKILWMRSEGDECSITIIC